MAKTTMTSIGDVTIQSIAQLDPPWGECATAWRKLFAGLLSFDSVVLGIVDPLRTTSDMFFLVDGLPRGAVADWCKQDINQDPLFLNALREGSQVTDHAQRLFTGHAIAATRPACDEHKTVWYLGFSRKDSPFTESEQRMVNTLLRVLATRFEFPGEVGLGHVLLGHTYQLLHADPITCLQFVQSPSLRHELATDLGPVIKQRWPNPCDYHIHNLFLSLDGRPTWARLRCGRVDSTVDRYACLELRTLEEADPPPIGLVEDERVARALAYLSDNFAQAPALADVAGHVNCSPFHFHRLFSRHAQISPKHFLLRVQLLHAKQFLRATRTPIGKVARMTGFASHGHFTSTFNRIVGCNPSDYREQF